MSSLMRFYEPDFFTINYPYLTDNIFSVLKSISTHFVSTNDTDNTITYSVDVPGISKDNLNITLDDYIITISGERVDDSNCSHSVSKSFNISENVDLNSETLKLENGVLNITFNKLNKENSNKRVLRIN
tara:strand:- start:218 stop:604 length:387 start_codon:yes stop_codon:yes gene_type:complete